MWFAALLGGVALVLIIAALAGEAPLVQLLGRAPRYEGMVALPALFAAGWAGARLLGPRASGDAYRQAVTALTLGSLLLAGLALLEGIGLRPLESDLERPGSLTGNATDQGILGAIFAAILGSALIGTFRRTGKVAWWALAGLLGGLVSVATSASRAGLLALAIVVVGLGIRFVVSSPRRGRDAAVASVAVLVAFLIVVAVPLTRQRLFGVDDFARQTIGDRLLIWDDSWQLYLSSPWVGVGPSGYADAITGWTGYEWVESLDSPHNIVLQAAVTGGFIGVALAAAVVGGALVVGVAHARDAGGARRDLLIGALVAVPAAGVALLTHLTSPVTLVPLAMLVGVVVAAPPREGASRTRKAAVTMAVGGWVALLIASTVADAVLLDARRAAAAGDLDGALSSFDTAQALRPWDVDVALIAAQSLGSALENGLAGAADPASLWAERAVSILPHSSRAQLTAGMVALGRGAPTEAASHLARAAELSPSDPRIHHELGVALLISGDPGAARAPLEQATEIAPSSAISWVALRDACAALGDSACVQDAERGERAARD